MEKPKKENYGYVEAYSPEDETGWILEGGEEAYYEAYAKWIELNDKEG